VTGFEMGEIDFLIGGLERFPNGLNREGFPNQQRSDSSCMLVKEASMHGQSPFG
jgi:hypothetical protein